MKRFIKWLFANRCVKCGVLIWPKEVAFVGHFLECYCHDCWQKIVGS